LLTKNSSYKERFCQADKRHFSDWVEEWQMEVKNLFYQIFLRVKLKVENQRILGYDSIRFLLHDGTGLSLTRGDCRDS
jgi:hypothetical protein